MARWPADLLTESEGPLVDRPNVSTRPSALCAGTARESGNPIGKGHVGSDQSYFPHLHAHGVKVRTLVEASGLSRQRVHQIINGPAAGLPGAATAAKARARADMDKAERLMNQARMREASERRTQALTPADVERLIDVLRNG